MTCLRSLLATLLLVLALSGQVCAAEIELEVRETKVGETLILDFKGNKRAAHGWRLVKDESRGLELLDVNALGWILSQEGKGSLFRSLDTMRFVVQGKAQGEADLIFEHNYRNVRGHFMFKRKQVRVIVKPVELQKTAN